MQYLYFDYDRENMVLVPGSWWKKKDVMPYLCFDYDTVLVPGSWWKKKDVMPYLCFDYEKIRCWCLVFDGRNPALLNPTPGVRGPLGAHLAKKNTDGRLSQMHTDGRLSQTEMVSYLSQLLQVSLVSPVNKDRCVVICGQACDESLLRWPLSILDDQTKLVTCCEDGSNLFHGVVIEWCHL